MAARSQPIFQTADISLQNEEKFFILPPLFCTSYGRLNEGFVDFSYLRWLNSRDQISLISIKYLLIN